MRVCRTVAVLVGILLIGGAALVATNSADPAWAAGAELLELPRPDLNQLEPGIQERLQAARSELDKVLSSAEASPADLGLAFGELGKLYYVYDLTDLSQICFLNAQSLLPDDYRWPHYLGVIHILDGEPQAAETSLLRALELEPGDQAARVRLGDVQYQLGNLSQAAEIYDQVLASEPNSAAALYGLGRVASQQGDHETAIERFEAALELQPAANSIHHPLGMAFRQQGDLEQARSHLALNRGGRLRIEDPLMDELGSLLQSSQMYFDAGVDAMRRGDYESALRSFSIARDLKPDDYLIPYNIALALLSTGQEAEAVAWLRTSVTLNPSFRDGQFNLAMMLANRGDLEEAAGHFREAHRIDPEDAEAHLQWATVLGLTGKQEQAISELRALLAIHPSNSEALQNLGILLIQQQRVGESVEVFERLTRVAEDPAAQLEAHLRLATIEAERGREAVALGHYQAALALDDNSLEAHLGLAAALGRQGRFTAAAEEYGRVLALDSSRQDAQFGRVTSLILGQRYRQAIIALEEILLEPSAPLAFKHVLAQLLAGCPEEEVRNGQRALILAQEVFQAEQTLDHAQTVAMALAETGRFEEAADLQARVVEQADRAGMPEVAKLARARLAKYQRGEAVRAPWLGG